MADGAAEIHLLRHRNQTNSPVTPVSQQVDPVPDWLKRCLGEDCFATAEGLWALQDSRLDDDRLSQIGEFPDLRWIDLRNTAVGDSGLVHLAGMEHLEQLTLAGTEISDAGIVHLCTLKSLRELDLANTDVSDKGLLRLASLRNLETLAVGNTRVTPAGIQQFLADKPGCSVDDDYREMPKMGGPVAEFQAPVDSMQQRSPNSLRPSCYCPLRGATNLLCTKCSCSP